ncbi:hypothetical protein [Kineococcus sp. G2]|uniref:hypothetical protein n=1 Tax=Kineococcus sp. G2 TaxID=3127484 RepID=UPI00301C3514
MPATSAPPRSIGVAVIGAGMAGRAHIAGYRTASTLSGGPHGEDLPGIRLVAVADAHAPFAEAAAERYGYRQVLSGPAHPYVAGGPAMDFPSVGHGRNDFFVFQRRAFLNEIAGGPGTPIGDLPVVAHGLHDLRVPEAVTRAAGTEGGVVPVA